MATTTAVTSERGCAAEYARLEERILARDQVGASRVLYGLLKQARPVTEILRETVRIHAPYTHVPYHQRLDDGVVKFVNNDHCLLSERVGLSLVPMISPELRYLPLAQTVWYTPTGLDPWNQLLGKAPGHYTRLYDIQVNTTPPMPERHWPDQEPVHVEGPLRERLNHWLTLVQRGEVLPAYRMFLGLMQDVPNRREVLAHLAFAGLIDVQDRMWHNRSYTTGHKGYRARATIEIGNAIGWDRAHDVRYAGVPDIAVGPRWYSTYEAGCNIVQNVLHGRDAELPGQDTPPTPTQAPVRRRALHQPRLRAPGQHAGQRAARHRAAGRLGRVVVASDPPEARGRASRAAGRGVGGLDGGLSQGRLRSGPAGAGAGDRGVQDRQRSAQPGARLVHAGGLPPHPSARPRAAAPGARAAHRGTSEVRGSAGGVPALRRGAGARRALSGATSTTAA